MRQLILTPLEGVLVKFMWTENACTGVCCSIILWQWHCNLWGLAFTLPLRKNSLSAQWANISPFLGWGYRGREGERASRHLWSISVRSLYCEQRHFQFCENPEMILCPKDPSGIAGGGKWWNMEIWKCNFRKDRAGPLRKRSLCC